MLITLFLSLGENSDRYGNGNSQNLAFNCFNKYGLSNKQSVVTSKCGDNCSVKHRFNISRDAGVTAIARTIQLNNRAKMASTD